MRIINEDPFVYPPNSNAMENNANMIEVLFENATDYSKTSFELIKLKTLDKTSEMISSIIPHSVVFVFIASFMLFLNLGLAFWFGQMLGQVFYGFFLIAAFYIVLGTILHFFMHTWLKKIIQNYIIKQAFK